MFQAYYDTFADGYNHYTNGDWKRAKRVFEFVPKMKGMVDEVSLVLLAFMKIHDFIAPPNWKGVREVDI